MPRAHRRRAFGRVGGYMEQQKMKIALVHDYFTQWGGAERVVEVLHEAFPDAPIYTTVVDRAVLPNSMRDADIRPSFLQGMPFLPRALMAYVPLLPMAIASLDLSGYDVVLSSSSAFAHGVRAKGKHIAYVYNTMRFAWDSENYLMDYPISPAVKAAAKLAAPLLRRWDKTSAQRPDQIVAISKVVAKRISERWGRDADVIYPPVDLSSYRIGEGLRSHFAVVSRLVPYKRIDLAIKAVNETGDTLLVVGDGPDKTRLEQLAMSNVRFLGWLSDADKRRVIEGAVAVIVPGVEDFGILPVEANACGTPVIAPALGGVAESQVDGLSAVLYPETTVRSIIEAIQQVKVMKFSQNELSRNAERFSKDIFIAGLQQLIEDL